MSVERRTPGTTYRDDATSIGAAVMNKITEERLKPNCAKCHALCCVALEFDWPHYKKPAGVPCKNLTEDFQCAIWDRLEEEGYSECRSHNCFGAGQSIAQAVKKATGCSWREDQNVKNVEFSQYLNLFAELHEKLTGRRVPGNEEDRTDSPAEQPTSALQASRLLDTAIHWTRWLRV